jgi:hypothetical protein
MKSDGFGFANACTMCQPAGSVFTDGSQPGNLSGSGRIFRAKG